MADHNLLIEQLSRTMTPVRRPYSPGWRVVTWVAMSLPAGALASLLVQRTFTDWTQSGAGWVVLQLMLTFVVGVLAVRNAFLMSIAGQRPLGWTVFAPLIVAWFGIAVANMPLHHTVPATGQREGANCYLFMMVVSLPMIAIVMGYLRRTRSLVPARSLSVAGAGVACMALTLLALCHPAHVSVADFVLHIAATATIVLATIAFGYKWIALP